MIPKLIHYCWFGNNKMSELNYKCIESWENCMPDYEVIRWDESNFDIGVNRYVYQAYSEHKYAFVSDYVRLYALQKYGGIYLDTDTEVVRNFDSLLGKGAFFGLASIEEEREIIEINTACIGSERNNPMIEYLLSYYDEANFFNEDGSYNTKTNSKIITEMLEGFMKKENICQTINLGDTKIYTRDFFDPYCKSNGKLKTTDNTYAIHWHDCSWGRPSNETDRIMGVIRRAKNKLLASLRSV